ncbi:MAG: ribosomal protein L7/L12 [Chloroflexi bacterium]|nr:ribosomal protein L7/L12 [Chloroflexota bacterium]
MRNQKEPTNLGEVIRLGLELLGVVEPRGQATRQRLALFNKHQKRGPATVILLDIGPKKISAITAVRKITNLDLNDVMTLVDIMLPLPILTNVDVETAVTARELLEAMGAEVKLTGMPQAKVEIETKTEAEPEVGVELAASFPMSEVEPVQAGGDFVVVLQGAGLMPDRIAQIVSRLTGWEREEAETAVADLPQPLFLGVTEAVAHKAQRELQMLGAVADVLRWDEYDAG